MTEPLIARAADDGRLRSPTPDPAKLEPYLGAYALSIRAPWPAWIMGTGPDRKRFENRMWRSSSLPRYRGPVLIHLSQWWDETEVCDTVEQVRLEWRHRFAFQMFARIPDALSTLRKLHALRGCLLGWVDLVDIRPGADLRGEFWTYDDAGPKHHCLVLDNPRMLPEPVPCRGALGLFKVKA